MTAVTIRSDFRAHENKICHCFHFLPFFLPWSDWTGCHDWILVFWMLSFKPTFCSHLHFQGYWYFLLTTLIPACESSSLAFCMMYFAYKLNKQSDSIKLCRTSIPILNQSIIPCPVLTCFLTCIPVSQETDKVFWYSHLFKNFPQFIVIYTVKGFRVVNEEVDKIIMFFTLEGFIQIGSRRKKYQQSVHLCSLPGVFCFQILSLGL